MKVVTEFITPAKAEEYLKAIADNQRPLNSSQVAFYAKMMQAGQWQLNGEAIKFDVNGKLIDGQHRLKACCVSGVPFETAVVYQVQSDAIFTIDTGTKRTSAQILKMNGVSNYSSLSVILSRFLKLRDGTAHSLDTLSAGGDATVIRGRSIKTSPADLLEIYDNSREYWDKIRVRANTCYCHLRLIPRDMIGAIAAHLHLTKGYNYEFVWNFFEQLFFEERCFFTAIRLLRSKLIQDKMSSVKMSGLMKTQLIIKTWNYYKKGKSPKNLSWNASEPLRVFE